MHRAQYENEYGNNDDFVFIDGEWLDFSGLDRTPPSSLLSSTASSTSSLDLSSKNDLKLNRSLNLTNHQLIVPHNDGDSTSLKPAANTNIVVGSTTKIEDKKDSIPPGTSLTLEPIPKYEWRGEASKKRQQQQQSTKIQQKQQQQSHSSSSSLPQEDQQYQQQCPDGIERPELEVFPGVRLPLRGSLETQDAITRGAITRGNCLGCTLEVCVIDDAEYVLCPLCRCVTPLELTAAEGDESLSPISPNNHSTISSSNISRRASFGVGLGFIED